MMNWKVKIMLILMVTALAASCTVDTVCHTEEQKVTVNVGTDSETWNTVTVRGIGSDSVLYNQSKNLKLLSLPLRVDTNITQFSIEYKQQADTLSIRHINNYQYISLACGCSVYHVIDSVWSTQHFIQAANITDSDVQPAVKGKEAVENIRLTLNEN